MYDAAEGPVLEFWGGHLMRNPRLTYANLENLLIKEYADEGTTVEAEEPHESH